MGSSPTTVHLRITNTSAGGSGIGCVTVEHLTPGNAFQIVSVKVASTSHGLNWSGSAPAPAISAHAATITDRILGDPNDDQLVLDVSVVGKIAGPSVWAGATFIQA